MKTRTCRAGFTLVELLVVIVIVATLAAISIVATQRVMAKSRMVATVSDMRQISLLILGATSEENGRLPALQDFDESDPSSAYNLHWLQKLAVQLYPEVQVNQILNDKEWWLTEKPIVLNQMLDKKLVEPLYTGYAMNFFISENHLIHTNGSQELEDKFRHRTPLASIQDQARTPLLVPHWNWHTEDLLEGESLSDPEKSKSLMSEGQLNVVFVDGHAEMIRFADNKGNALSVSEYAERKLNEMPRYD